MMGYARSNHHLGTYDSYHNAGRLPASEKGWPVARHCHHRSIREKHFGHLGEHEFCPWVDFLGVNERSVIRTRA